MKIRVLAIIFLALSILLVWFLFFSDRFVQSVIAKSPSGETVVMMGSGLGWLLGVEPTAMDPHTTRYEIQMIEYRDAKGKTLARYRPRFAPNDYAAAIWTDNLVLIKSGQNGECPDLRVVDARTGAEIDHVSDRAMSLPSEILVAFDPCGWGSEKNQKWLKDKADKQKK